MGNNLPNWAEWHPTSDNTVLVDPDIMYPYFLKEYGVAVEKASRYWIEVCYQSMKLDLQATLRRSDFIIHVRADDGRKERWALKNFTGLTEEVHRATHGREAREHYKKLRGFIPSW